MYIFIDTLYNNILNNDQPSRHDLINNEITINYYSKLFNSIGLINFDIHSEYIKEQIDLDDMSLSHFKKLYSEYLTAQQLSKSSTNFFNPVILRTYYKNEKQWINHMINYIRFNMISIIFCIAYSIGNAIIFYSTFSKLYKQVPIMNSIKIYKSLAKSSASIILLNTLISILPLLTYRIRLINYVYIPHYLSIVLHYLCFVMIVIFTILHVICHIIILIAVYSRSNVCIHNALELDRLGINTSFNTYITLLPVWTGIVLCILLIIFMILWILLKYKKLRHSIFYNYHIMIALAYFIMLMLHGSLNWLRTSQAYYWCIPIMVIYLVDKYIKIFHTNKLDACYAQVAVDKYIKLTIIKTNLIITDPSMTLDIKIPAISKFEWHKFTITTAPDDEHIVLYMQVIGKWTKKLQNYIIEKETLSEQQHVNIMVYTDKPTNNVIKYTTLYKKILLISTGYGITPYISLIRDIIYNPVKYKHIIQIDIIWIINNDTDFQIFKKTLNEVYKVDFLKLHIYFTKNIESEIKESILFLQELVHIENNFDIISGMHTNIKTTLAKPDFNIILQNLLKSNRTEKSIGIFFCGNPFLQKKILRKCYKYSNNTLDIQLNFHKID